MARITGGGQPWWTAVVVTASSERQAERYRHEIQCRREQQKLPPSRYCVVADPGGRRIGSGAATIHALWRYSAAYGAGWERDRVLMLHCGGDSRRLPQYSLAGKLFTELPVRTPWGDVSTVFDETLALSTPWAERMDAGLLVASGDVVLTFDSAALDWRRPGVSGVAMRQPVETGAAHGVYVIGDDGRVYSFLQKPPAAQVRASGGVLEGGGVALDTGLLRFDPELAACVAALGAQADWGKEPEDPIDLYQHVTMALTGQWTPETGAGRLMRSVAEVLGGRPFSCALVEGDFTHVGTTTGFRKLITEETNFTRLYEARQRLGSVAPPGVAQCAGVVIDSVLRGGEIEPGAIVIHCDFEAPVRAARGSILHNVSGVAERIEVPEDTVVHQVPVHLPDGRRGFVVRVYGVGDDPKRTVSSGEATWFGRPVRDVLATFGIDEESAWEEIPPESRSLWNAKLFTFGPVGHAWAFARSLLGSQAMSTDAWRGSERLSLESSAVWSDVAAQAEARSRRMQAHWQLTAVSLARSGTDLRPMLAHAPGIGTLAATGGSLIEQARSCASAAPTEAASLYYQASLFLRQAGLEKQAGEAREAAFQSVRCAVEAGAGAGQLLAPDPQWRPGTVRVSAPPRMDLGGGWSDTPPFCLDWGGTVLNIAILPESRYPISTSVRRLDAPVLRCVSTESGEAEEYRETVDLQAPLDPGSAFAIPRTAFRMAGLAGARPLREALAAAGGGLEIVMTADLPMGSGLGTSSILAATVLRALSEVAGTPLGDRELSEHVMTLEQTMTTGGGWQDQAGGIFPGAKLLRTGPGLCQRLRVNPAAWDTAKQEEFRERFLFYYTGIRRIAKNLLTQVVGAYLAREAAVVQVLHSIKTLAEEMAYALEHGEWDYLGSLLDRHWQLNQVLDPNTTNAPINSLLDRVRSRTAGAKLAGAGGGGFLMLLAKDPAAAAELRGVLRDLPGGGALYDFEIAKGGLRVD